ncbi:hypothetical protein DID88_001421 [Monilinia fructigena]|uniref:Uncharacterized protein n=1 Tax=Monilinia fructigena TaxID=38457 RepID=A0A395IY67_9HELO|nr:hypothetical protein DID88_001421 [Monilinia fructigena]
MASELSRGNGIVPNEEQSPSSNADSVEFSSGSTASPVAFPYSSPPMSSAALLKRERRLRRAANYAADSLTMSDQFEVEDMRLLHKIQDVLNSAERKMNGLRALPPIDNCGYGTKILRVTAYMLNRAAVWPVTRIMAHALETQAVHMQTRTESSVSQR